MFCFLSFRFLCVSERVKERKRERVRERERERERKWFCLAGPISSEKWENGHLTLGDTLG